MSVEPVVTNLGRRLEVVEPKRSPDRVWVCRRRLHVFSLAGSVCGDCAAVGVENQPLDEFREVK